MQVIDCDGYRANVGIILCNAEQQLFWGKRVGQAAWQFPQGGVHAEETPEEAMFRELHEETGLFPRHVEVLGSTRHWLRYRLPERMVRRHQRPVCIGQKQRWFLLRMVGDESDVVLDAMETPEFDDWRWIDYWRPAREVVHFKRQVYRRALCELVPLMFPELEQARARRSGRRGPVQPQPRSPVSSR